MFLPFYGLREQPFGVTPDPRYLFLSRSHREALASLYYAIESKRGFSALVAEPGMGKTSLIFRLMDSLKNWTRTAFLFQSHGDSRSFLRSILHDSGISCSGQEDIPRMHQMLNEVLLEESLAGRQFVLVVDEAQNLSDELLESIRILSNCETPSAKLIHIILAGQSGLAQKLARPELVQLKQRVASIIQLSAFSLQETSDYIYHRLHIAGYREGCPFTDEAVALIHRFSDGTPRNINNICFQALSLGFAGRTKTIGVEIISEVLADLGIFAHVPPPSLMQPGIPRLQPFAEVPAPSRLSDSQAKWRVPLLGLLAVPFLFVLAFRGSALNGTAPGRLTQRLAADIAGDSNVPSIASPPPPKSSDAPDSSDASNTLPASEKLTSPVEPAVESHQEPAEPGEEQKRTPTSERQKSRDSRANAKQAAERRPHVVVARRSETVFQFALEYYGKADWTVIHGIGAVNPEISDPYQIIQEGQRVVLPDLSSELAQKSKAFSAMSTQP